MELSAWMLGMFLSAALLGAFTPAPGSDLFEIDVRLLAEIWEKEHRSPPDPHSLKHAELKRVLEAIAKEFPKVIRVSPAGSSVEGREIFVVKMGTGPKPILFWSQMHGDEPTATSSLLDLFHFFGQHESEAWVSDILKQYTLLFIPMLNPDGAERNQRRNAQGIDINRDARALQSPEGRLLKSIRDEFKPFLGFNLHNQNSQTTVAETGKVATIALLAVAADAARYPNRDDQLAKRVTAVLYEALSPFVYGHISRYDEDYNPRAFGDNFTLWETPVILIESGGRPRGQLPNFTVKLNFIGILAVLNSLASGRLQNANPAIFDSMKRNSDVPIFDLLLRNAWIFTGTGVPLFKGDVAIRGDSRAGASNEAFIADVGDLSVFTAHESIDCTGMLVTPGLIAWDPGQSLFADKKNDRPYLRRGILSLLESAYLNTTVSSNPDHGSFQKEVRSLHWGFVLVGDPPRPTSDVDVRAADWLAAGGRAWIVDSTTRAAQAGIKKVAGWFGVELLSRAEALKFELPQQLEGDPVLVLQRWTSEAARRFRLPRRGIIAPGAAADLVIWSTGSREPPKEIRECHPVRIILGGQNFEPEKPHPSVRGKFLGR